MAGKILPLNKMSGYYLNYFFKSSSTTKARQYFDLPGFVLLYLIKGIFKGGFNYTKQTWADHYPVFANQ